MGISGTKHRVKTASIIFWVFLARFWSVFYICVAFLAIFVIFSPYLVIPDILQLFAIFCHFLTFFGNCVPFFSNMHCNAF